MGLRDRLRRIYRDQTGAVSADIIVLTIGLALVGVAVLILMQDPAPRGGDEAAEVKAPGGDAANGG